MTEKNTLPDFVLHLASFFLIGNQDCAGLACTAFQKYLDGLEQE